MYLTLSDQRAIRQIIAARGTLQPEPQWSGPWWKRPRKRPVEVTAVERQALLEGLDALLEHVGF